MGMYADKTLPVYLIELSELIPNVLKMLALLITTT